MKYIHYVQYYESHGHFATIATRAKFKKRMLAHYFKQKNPQPLMFYLEGLPTKTRYEVVAYRTNQGKPSLCYILVRLKNSDPVLDPYAEIEKLSKAKASSSEEGFDV